MDKEFKVGNLTVRFTDDSVSTFVDMGQGGYGENSANPFTEGETDVVLSLMELVREACAQIAEGTEEEMRALEAANYHEELEERIRIAEAIRARGEK